MADRRIRNVVRYSGTVQGVGFRMTAVSQSRGLDVHGFVRNESDGSVEMDVEGEASQVKELMRRIETAMAGKIDAVEIDPREPKGNETGFTIRY